MWFVRKFYTQPFRRKNFQIHWQLTGHRFPCFQENLACDSTRSPMTNYILTSYLCSVEGDNTADILMYLRKIQRHDFRVAYAFRFDRRTWNPLFLVLLLSFTFSPPPLFLFQITRNVTSRRGKKCFLCTEVGLVPRGMLRAWHSRTYEITFWNRLSLPLRLSSTLCCAFVP